VSEFIAAALAGSPLKVFGRGTRRQDYVDVRDIAIAITQGIATRTSGVINVGSGRATSNLELARLVLATLSSPSRIEMCGVDPEEGKSWEVSIKKALEILGYCPAISLQQSIADMAANPQMR